MFRVLWSITKTLFKKTETWIVCPGFENGCKWWNQHKRRYEYWPVLGWDEDKRRVCVGHWERVL